MVFVCGQTLSAQDLYMTRSGTVHFFSKMPLEDIEANNSSSTFIFRKSEGKIAVKILMKSFDFDKAAMQEHFNNDYVESEQISKCII